MCVLWVSQPASQSVILGNQDLPKSAADGAVGFSHHRMTDNEIMEIIPKMCRYQQDYNGEKMVSTTNCEAPRTPRTIGTNNSSTTTGHTLKSRLQRRHLYLAIFLICSTKVFFRNVTLSIGSQRPGDSTEHTVLSLGPKVDMSPTSKQHYLRASVQWGWPDASTGDYQQLSSSSSSTTATDATTTSTNDVANTIAPKLFVPLVVKPIVEQPTVLEDGVIPEVLILAAKKNPKKYRDRVKRIKQWQDFGQNKVANKMIRKTLKEMQEEKRH